MTISTKGTWILALVLAVSGFPGAWAADIYKTVDENGDPVYTDRPPFPDAKPLNLRELSVVEAPSYPDANRSNQDDDDGQEGPTLNQMRAEFRDFALVSPAPDQNFWGTANTATIAWNASSPLLPDMGVVFYVDGEAIGDKTRSATVSTGRLDRGEHQASADLVDANGQVVASAGPVTFYIMQQSRRSRVN